MSEPSNLVPNLNEIMEEYAKWEEEAVQTTQAETGQEGEKVESKAEVELERGREELKKLEQKVVEKKQATGF